MTAIDTGAMGREIQSICEKYRGSTDITREAAAQIYINSILKELRVQILIKKEFVAD